MLISKFFAPEEPIFAPSQEGTPIAFTENACFRIMVLDHTLSLEQ